MHELATALHAGRSKYSGGEPRSVFDFCYCLKDGTAFQLLDG